MIKDEELIHKAKQLINPRKLFKSVNVGQVASAIITDKGNIYVGVCLDIAWGIGFCAETNVIANMITHNESRIITIVAVDQNGKIISPCGRCRELIY